MTTRGPVTGDRPAAPPRYSSTEEKDPRMDRTHSQFLTLSPTTVDDFADNFDSAVLAAMQSDVAALADGNGLTADAWHKVIATLGDAREQRLHLEESRQAPRLA